MVFVLIYVPVNFQRRFLEGWQIPVVILAAIGWRRRVRPWLADRLRPRALRTVTVVTTICLILTPLFLVAEGLASVFSANRPFTYLDRDTSRAIDWLRANTETGETVVFTGYEIGNVLPAWVPVRTTLGHWSLTTHIDDRRDDFERFYDAATPDAERIAILRDLGVDYVYAGAEEREAGDFAPDVAPYLAPVFSSETASIYRFESE